MKISDNTKNSSQNRKPSGGVDKNSQLYRLLPFTRRKEDFGVWIYRNKYGVVILVLAIIILFFIFATIRIEYTTITLKDGFMVEMAKEEEKIEEVEEKKTPAEQKMELLEKQYYEQVRNQAANRASELDGGLKDDKGTQASDIYEEARRVQERLEASKAEYQRGVAESKAIKKRQNNPEKGKNKEKREQSNVKGSVTVSFNLDGRHAAYLPVPSYKCQEGGEVEIEIRVNRSGDVISASVSKSTSKGSSCLNETALSFAKSSRFQVGTNWPDKQKGTITYIFLSQ